MSLSRHAIRSTVSGSAFQAARVVANLGGAVVVGRILSPEDFGTFALAISFNGLVLAFRHAGLPLASTGRSELSPALESNLFWLTFAVGSLCALVLLGAAPLVGLYYGSAEIGWIAAAISLTLVIEAASAQHGAKLRRELRFDAVNASELIGVGLGAVAAVVGALAGLGVWALVLQRWVAALALLAAVWGVTRWVPSWPARRQGTRALIRVGSWLMLYEFIWLSERSIREAIIGRLAPVAAFGQFSRSLWLTAVPEQMLAAPVRTVAAPILARISEKGADDRGAADVLRAIALLDTVGALAVGLVIGGAQDAFVALLGPQWHEGARLFQISVFALVGAASASFLGGLVVTVAHGRAWAWIAGAIAVTQLFAAVGGYFAAGLTGATAGIVAATLLTRFTSIAYPLAKVGVRYRDYLLTIAPPALVCLLAGGAGISVRILAEDGLTVWPRGALSVLAAAAVGVAAAALLRPTRASLAREWRRVRGGAG